jgi:hypothetical protein
MEEIKNIEATPAAVNPQATQQPQPQSQPRRPQPKAKGMSFGNMFLAALLAVVAGSVVTFVFWIALFSGVSAALQGAPTVVPKSAILKIDLAENIADAPAKNPMAGFDIMTMEATSELTLFNALKAIDAAKGDDRIKGIYLNLNGAGLTTINIMEELRTAIEEFKKSGKWVVAYNDIYSQWNYYLSSVADKVYIETNLKQTQDGRYYADEIGTYYIIYKVDDFKYDKIFTVQRIRLITFVESSESDIVVD